MVEVLKYLILNLTKKKCQLLKKAFWNLRQEHNNKINLLNNLIVLLKISNVHSLKKESSKDLFSTLFKQEKIYYSLDIIWKDF